MRLIHCADLHLDSPMGSNLSPKKARERAREIREGFLALARYADENGVAAILIAGDLFDSQSVRASTLKYVLETVAAFPHIGFYYLAGNHDRGGAALTVGEHPENLYPFFDAWTSYDVGEVTVTGSERPHADTLSLDPTRVNIVLLHGQERTGRGSADGESIPLGHYKGKGIDYLALGHVHDYRAKKLDARATVAYSGCLEGRGFDECGEHGFVLLEVEKGKITHRFIPFARRRLHTVEVDIGEANTHLLLEACVLEAVKEIPDTDLVKVVLTGKRRAEAPVDTAGLASLLSERFYFAKVRDESGLLICAEDYQNDISLKGEFVRRVMASSLSEREKERVIACGLRALSGEELGV